MFVAPKFGKIAIRTRLISSLHLETLTRCLVIDTAAMLKYIIKKLDKKVIYLYYEYLILKGHLI